MTTTAMHDPIPARLAAVRARFDAWDVAGLLIGSAANRRWLSGFTGSSGQLLISRERALLITDSRYWERARQEAPHFELWKQGSNRKADLQAGITAAGAERVGLEADHVTVASLKELGEVDGVAWVPLTRAIEPLRAVKAPVELDAIRRAASLADQAMARVLAWARPGVSEAELAWRLERQMRENGAEAIAFDIIVAGGPNAALPHHKSGPRLLTAGDAIVVDLGARVDGYHSDLTRSFFLGSAPDERFLAVYETVARAEAAALAGLRPGLTGREADALARDVIVAAGYGDYFGHSLGHGVGLEVHEEPRLSGLQTEGRLAAGMLTTVEPGIYLPDWGGVRLEDLVLLTDDGIEVLSQSPYEPAIPI